MVSISKLPKVIPAASEGMLCALKNPINPPIMTRAPKAKLKEATLFCKELNLNILKKFVTVLRF